MEPTLQNLMDWARAAGAILREGYGKRHQIDRKGRIDLVTEIDHQSEDYLLGQIRAHFPEHTIEAEESGLLTGSSPSRWFVDPLDGTTNYAHAIPIFSVSFAYAQDGSTRLGVVYDPMRDELFCAERGKGAWLNDEPIHVSDTSDMVQSLLVTGFPYNASISLHNLEYFSHFTRLSQGVRRLGSAALDLSYVAAGRFEGFWELTLKPWDFAAGALILQEAGGIVTSIQGSEDLFQPPYSILGANPALHPQMLAEFPRV